MICRNPRFQLEENCKIIPALGFIKMIPSTEASKIYLKEVQHFDNEIAFYAFAATMSDGTQIGYVNHLTLKRTALPKELKKIEVIFFDHERYLQNIKFYAKDGSQFSLSQRPVNGPVRVETVEFAENEHLLSCEIDIMFPGHGHYDICGITWIKWQNK